MGLNIILKFDKEVDRALIKAVVDEFDNVISGEFFKEDWGFKANLDIFIGEDEKTKELKLYAPHKVEYHAFVLQVIYSIINRGYSLVGIDITRG